MYLYYSADGRLLESINDKNVRQADDGVNFIYIYCEDTTAKLSGTIRYKRSDETTIEEVINVQPVLKEIPFDKKRTLKYFENFKKYEFIKIQVPTTILSAEGLASATVRFVIQTSPTEQGLLSLGVFTFLVEESVIAPDTPISLSQWNYLIEQLAKGVTIESLSIALTDNDLKLIQGQVAFSQVNLEKYDYQSQLNISNGIAQLDSDAKLPTNKLHTDSANNVPTLDSEGKIRDNQLKKAIPNGLATLGADGKVPNAQLPSYVDDVLEFDTFDDFPVPAEKGKIYVALDTNYTYRWSGSTFIRIGGFDTEWGAIIGDIDQQEDLKNKLDNKADLENGKVPFSELPDGIENSFYEMADLESHTKLPPLVKGKFIALRKPAPQLAYSYKKKINDFYYDFVYENLGGSYSGGNQFELSKGGCSAFFHDGIFGKSLDWTFDYGALARVIVKANPALNRRKSIALCGTIKAFSKQFLDSGIYDDEIYRNLPYYAITGFNDSNLVCTTNVVPLDKGFMKASTPLIEEREVVSETSLVRYILDKFDEPIQAFEYIRDYVKVVGNPKLAALGYTGHYFLANTKVYLVLEFLKDEFGNFIATSSNMPLMTNFYVNDVTFNTDGKVYIPLDVPTHTPSENGITDNGSGLERFNLIVDNFSSITGIAEAQKVLESLDYIKSYFEDTFPFWYTEGVGAPIAEGSTIYTTVNSPVSDFQYVKSVMIQRFQTRSRDTGLTWYSSSQFVMRIGTGEYTFTTPYDSKHWYYFNKNEPDPVILQAYSYELYFGEEDGWKFVKNVSNSMILAFGDQRYLANMEDTYTTKDFLYMLLVRIGHNNFNLLDDKPSINGVVLGGDKSSSELSLPSLDANGKIPVSQIPNGFDNIHSILDFETRTELPLIVEGVFVALQVDNGDSTYSYDLYKAENLAWVFKFRATNEDLFLHDNKLYRLALDNNGKTEESVLLDIVKEVGVDDYEILKNRPQINGNLLSGNKSNEQLGVICKLNVSSSVIVSGITIPDLTYQNVLDFVNALQNGKSCFIDYNHEILTIQATDSNRAGIKILYRDVGYINYYIETSGGYAELKVEIAKFGEKNYPNLLGKPQLNGQEILGNQTGDYYGLYKVISTTAHQTINGYEVPTLSVADVNTAYNSVVAGKSTKIYNSFLDLTLSVISADVFGGETQIRVLFTDTMILTYTISNNAVVVSFTSRDKYIPVDVNGTTHYYLVVKEVQKANGDIEYSYDDEKEFVPNDRVAFEYKPPIPDLDLFDKVYEETIEEATENDKNENN